MHLLHLSIWFIAYSTGIASAAAVLFSYHRKPSPRGKILVRLQLSLLLFVFAASFISFSYELRLSQIHLLSAFSFIAHLCFFFGLAYLSICLRDLNNELKKRNRKQSKTDLMGIVVMLAFLLQSFCSLSVHYRRYEAIQLIGGVLQVFLFLILSIYSIRTGLTIIQLRFPSQRIKRILWYGMISVFIIAVFTTDILFGTYRKLKSGEELSIFLMLPLYSCGISLSLVGMVMKKRKQGPRQIFVQAGLSPRETEVALLLMEGRSYRDIGEKLYISLATVQSHVKSIYRKTDCSNKTELSNYAKGS